MADDPVNEPHYLGHREPPSVRRESRLVPLDWDHGSTAEGIQHVLRVGVEHATEAEREAAAAIFSDDGRDAFAIGADFGRLADDLRRYWAMLGVPLPNTQPMTLRERLHDANRRLRLAHKGKKARVGIAVLAGQLGYEREYLHALARKEDPPVDLKLYRELLGAEPPKS